MKYLQNEKITVYYSSLAYLTADVKAL